MTRSRDVADTQDNLGGAVAPYVAGKNAVINGGFDIWQRGTSVTGAGGGAYTTDRWFLNAGGQVTVSRQATGDTTNLPNIQYCARVQRNNASTDTTVIPFMQSFESANSIPFAGKTVTVSFYARKGANYSQASSQLIFYLISGTGTDQRYPSGYTGGAFPISNQTPTLTTTWQRFSYTATLSSNITELTTYFDYGPTGTAGAADYFEITGVQLELGAQSTPFARAGGSIGGELALCQRYYQRYNDSGSSVTGYCNGQAQTTTTAYFMFPLLVPMRIKPATLDINLIRATDYNTGFTPSGSITIYSGGSSSERVQLSASTFSGLTANRIYALESAGSTAAYIGIGAEL
jgi:hypothetical protein